jgi:hypothetical protein
VIDHTTIKIIRQKSRKFYSVSITLLLVLLFILLFIGAFLFTFWLSVIFSSAVILIIVVIFWFINRCYNIYLTLTRENYINSIFPIKEKLTKQQMQFILNDLEYIFGNYFNKEVEINSLSENSVNRLFNKIKDNNLTTRDREKLNLLYSENFIQLSEIKR